MNSSVPPEQQSLVTGGARHLDTPHKKHQLYMDKRNRAYLLETEIEDAQKEYIKKMVEMLKVMQKQFFTKYGEKIKDLEDIEESINFVQMQGLKELKRKLQTLYLESLDSENQEEFRQKSKKLRDDFQQLYFPKDKYQERRDKEAYSLQRAILGTTGAHQLLSSTEQDDDIEEDEL